MTQETTETSAILEPNFVIDAILDDKLDYTAARLLSQNQNRLLKTLKDKNEKER